MKKFLLLFSTTIAPLFSHQTLTKGDVQKTFEEMLSFHVEHDKMHPLLIERALKIYIDRFDRFKMLLTEKEAGQFLKVSAKMARRGVDDYYKNELAVFREVNRTIQLAIQRSRIWREEIATKLSLSVYGVEPQRGENYLAFASSEIELKERVWKQMVRLLFQEKELNRLESWSPEDREKIFTLWDRRFRRNEDKYLVDASEDEHSLVLHTLRALATSLDAHSSYFSPEEAMEMRTVLEKQFEGVGVVLREGIDGVTITDLIKGGPAEKSRKVEIGDRVVKVDGKSTSGMTYEDILKEMKGDGKKELRLTLLHRGSSEVEEVTLKREKITISDERLHWRSVPTEKGHFGVITLPSFYAGGLYSSAEADMREALKKLKREGNLQGVILDMRENGGGFLTQAVKIAGLFITKGVVVISKYAKGEIRYLRNLDGRLLFDGPLIILTSRASASATEIVAQALQDYGVALIVGDEETYGKGTIQFQTITDKKAQTFYKVTVGRYYTVSGQSTQIEGVKSDIVVPTIFSSCEIGERYLEYPLSRDSVASAYIDPLTDIDYRSRPWFKKNYLPNLYKPQDKWRKALPAFRKKSAKRLAKDQDFVTFMKVQKKLKNRSLRSIYDTSDPPWGSEDLQMKEALHILEDMAALVN